MYITLVKDRKALRLDKSNPVDMARYNIALHVKAIWEANRPEAMDRGVALAMLISNLEHETRLDKRMLYSNGTLTPDELAQMKEYWKTIDNKGTEYQKILEIVNMLEW